MASIVDAFSKEDRAEIAISQLIKVLDDRARAEANFDIAIKMCNEGIAPAIIARVFDKKEG